MAEVIYRKYRPKIFGEVVGQQPIKVTLQNEISSGHVAHAYLFVGPRGTGKTTLARLMARSLNCQERKSGESEPCNQCPSCTQMLRSQSLDVIEIDAASHTGVDNVRENIIANAQTPPFNPKGFKVFVIDEVHMLSKSAFNALLKTLEEPPAHAIFILATTEIHKVPETIISRCQRFDFRKIAQKDIVKRLAEISEWEKIKVEDHILAEIARRSDGCLRDAETLFGQIISLSKTGDITDEIASLALPRSHWKEADTLISALKLKNLAAALNHINLLVNEGIDLQNFFSDLVEYLRQIMLHQIIGPTANLDMADVQRENIAKHAVDWQLADISRLFNILLDKLTIKQAIVEQLPLELACIEYLLERSSQTVYENRPARPTEGPEQTILQHHWDKVVKDIKQINHALAIILMSAHPVTINEKQVIIGVQYNFHLEQLNKQPIKAQIAKTIGQSLARNIDIDIIVDNDYEDNHRRFKGAEESDIKEALDAFGGELI